MTSKHRPLPHTQLDGIKTFRPYVYRCAKEEAKARAARGEFGPTGSIDDSPWIKEVLRQAQLTFLSDAGLLRFGSPDQFFDGDVIRRDLLDARGASVLMAILTTVNYEFHSLVNFELSGSKTFRFADLLVEELAQTSSNVKAEYVHLPFNSCCFVIESRVAIEAFHQFLTRDSDAAQAVTEEMYATPLTVFVHEIEPRDATLGHPGLLFLAFHGDGKYQWGMAKRQVLLNPTWDVERALHTDWDKVHEEAGIDAAGIGLSFSHAGHEAHGIDDQSFYEDGLFFFRLLINMILYVTSSDPDLLPREVGGGDAVSLARMSSKERRTLRRETDRMAGLSVIETGSRLTALIVDPRAVEDVPRASSVRSGRYTVRFKVRGGFRPRRVGPGRKEVKIVWVREHWKGPEMAELVNRHYEVR
jgi:hypothetical protein